MEITNVELFNLLLSLLPGFVAAWVFHGITAHRKSNAFERVVHALIFTAFIFPTVSIIREVAYRIGAFAHSQWQWSDDLSLPLISLVVGITYGTFFSWIANTGWLHEALPDWLTKRTSFPSEWYSAFAKEKRYVYLHLDDERRIYGWPSEFPDHPDEGHFALMEAEWVLSDNQRAKLPLTQQILIPANKVVLVETEKRWDVTKWKPEEIETYSEEDLNTSVQKLVTLQESKDQEASEEDADDEEKDNEQHPEDG